ncbi:hypothetical protein [Dyadobacter sp. Leaf189]|uniref:hypothetical protein n=1 Tax=Dyadobacter sp. Leaf189 TaxID=1736295 RepID=UPI0006F82DA7|nr:hypothetical protein [Dyadobacter sp. Leaf189]KQS34057.1 hypothetical protein ASG33_08545 [Dyadobacter sp. Leaf189]
MNILNIVRKFSLIICILCFQQVFAQVKFDTKAANAPGKLVAKQVNTSNAVNLTVEEMTSLANLPTDFEQSNSFSVANQKPVGNGKSVALDNHAEEKLDMEIYGSGSPREYGVTYMSRPVRIAYDNYIAPYVPTFLELNDEIYEGKAFRNIIAMQIANQLVLISENMDAFKAKGARDMLRLEVLAQLANETYPPESETQDYWEEHLAQIAKRVAPHLDFGDFHKSLSMLSSFAARCNCALSVIIANSKINTIKNESKLTSLLWSAKSNFLYQPLTEYRNREAVFHIYVMKVAGLQAATQDNSLYKFYDKDNQCPSGLAYSFIFANKLRSASVFNK